MDRGLDTTKSARSRRRWIMAALIAATLGMATAYAFFLRRDRPRGPRHEALALALSDAVDAFEAQRWERPVLRGAPLDGNASEAQRRALAEGGLTDLPPAPFEDAASAFRGEAPPSAELVELAARHRDALERYRGTTRRAWAWGDYDVWAGADAPLPSYIDDMRASRLLLVLAQRSEPRRCLAIGADVLRLGQDRTAGMGLVPLMIHRHVAEDAFGVMAECLRRADPEALRAAERELTILARHPAPTGSAMELEALIMGATFSNQLTWTPRIPTDLDQLESWWHAGEMLDAWELLMGDPRERRAWGAEYPDGLEQVQRWEDEMAASGNDLVRVAAPGYRRYLARDATTRAMIRMLLAGARIRRAHEAPPADAPAALSEPLLRDPRHGAPFAWSVDGDAAFLRSPAPQHAADDDTGEREGALELRVVFTPPPG